MPCCGVIGKKEESTRLSASSRMIFGEFGSSSTMSDIVSNSLLGTTVLKSNSTMRSESGKLCGPGLKDESVRLVLDNAANNDLAHRGTKTFYERDEREIFHSYIL